RSTLPDATSTQRAAFEATNVSKCTRLTSLVSTSCASGSGAVTRTSGSSGKHTVPSGMASTSPVNRSAPSRWTKASSNRPDAATHASSSGVAPGDSREAAPCARPAASRKRRPGGWERANGELEHGRRLHATSKVRVQHGELIEVGEEQARLGDHHRPDHTVASGASARLASRPLRPVGRLVLLPEPEAAHECVHVGHEARIGWELLQQLRVAATEHDLLGFECRLEPHRDVL